MEARNKKQLFNTVAAVARRWHVSPFLVRQMIKDGKLRTVLLNRRRMIHRAELSRVESGEQSK